MDGAELAFAGAARQARMVADGEVSAVELVTATLERIERLDPQLNAYRVVWAERALLEAQQADARRGVGEERPLLGVPVAIKDDVDVAGEITARGTARRVAAASRDAVAVAWLRAAGAIVVGKTHLPELGLWPFTESLTHGATRNPWDPQRTPGGSSGGSAAAVAAGLCGLALGSDGAGSIRLPAAYCGVFGLKPQRDRVPLGDDRRDAWRGLVVNGPLARSVADAALLLDVTADGAGAFARAAATRPPRLRIAVASARPPGTVAKLGAAQCQALDATATLLRAQGHAVVERELDYPLSGATQVLARYLRGACDELARIDPPTALEPRTEAVARLGGWIPEPVMRRVRAGERGLAHRLQAVFADADVVLTPGPPGPPARVGSLQGRGAVWTLAVATAKVQWYATWNATGQPAASVPAGFDASGLPLAVQLVGRPGDEQTLLALAAELEAERPWTQARPKLG